MKNGHGLQSHDLDGLHEEHGQRSHGQNEHHGHGHQSCEDHGLGRVKMKNAQSDPFLHGRQDARLLQHRQLHQGELLVHLREVRSLLEYQEPFVGA